ncbi:hypothetical protein Leryth_002589 [Lithospermum erythrorhizon]|nr:hypothetical protein Leryth_002589 [Lithospermum erythrorhizon]
MKDLRNRAEEEMTIVEQHQFNGGIIETPSPRPRIQAHFHSTVSVQKLRRFNILIFIFRLLSFCFSLAAAIFMLANSRASKSPSWVDFDTFRFVAIANSIVGVYSLFQVVASLWDILRNSTLFPEIVQIWFDFGHDQAFGYMVLSANSAGTALARSLHDTDTCNDNNAFCVQSDISIALGFIGFLFLAFSALLSGFRVVCYLLKGSRFHL